MKYCKFLALLLFSACTSMFEYKAIVFRKDFPLNEKTFAIIPYDDQKNNIEYQTYAAVISDALKREGLKMPTDEKSADYKVFFMYDIDNGRSFNVAVPMFNSYGYAGSINRTEVRHNGIIQLDIINKDMEKVYESRVVSLDIPSDFLGSAQCFIKALFLHFNSENATRFIGQLDDCDLDKPNKNKKTKSAEYGLSN